MRRIRIREGDTNCAICGKWDTLVRTEFVWAAHESGERVLVKHKVCKDCIKQAVRQRLEILGRF